MPGIHDVVPLKPNVELAKVPFPEWMIGPMRGLLQRLALMLLQQQVIEVRWPGL
jgi:hypothetical protein